MIKTETKNINGKEVKIVLLGAREGIKIAMKLGKAVVPAFAQMIGSLKGTGNAGNIPFKDLVESCFDNLDELDLDKTSESLFRGATVDDFPITIDTYFQANYGELLDFLAFALEANFSSFFEASVFKSLISE